VFHEVSSSDDEALGFCLLASALLAPTEAQQAAERANELLPKVLDLAARIESEMNAAYLPARWITGFFPRSVADLIGTAKCIARASSGVGKRVCAQAACISTHDRAQPGMPAETAARGECDNQGLENV
jgi:hypothetical protein